MHTLFIVILLCYAMFFAMWLWFPIFFIPSVPKLGFVNSIHRENRHTCGIYIPLGCIVSTVDAMTIDAFSGKFIKCLFYSLCTAQCALHNHWARNGDFFFILWSLECLDLNGTQFIIKWGIPSICSTRSGLNNIFRVQSNVVRFYGQQLTR